MPPARQLGSTGGLDPNVGALTQSFREFAPDDAPAMIYGVVTEIDGIVNGITEDNSGRAATYNDARLVRQPVRDVLCKHQMHGVQGLFDRAYVYIAEHYGQQSTPFPARAGREREGNNSWFATSAEIQHMIHDLALLGVRTDVAKARPELEPLIADGPGPSVKLRLPERHDDGWPFVVVGRPHEKHTICWLVYGRHGNGAEVEVTWPLDVT